MHHLFSFLTCFLRFVPSLYVPFMWKKWNNIGTNDSSSVLPSCFCLPSPLHLKSAEACTLLESPWQTTCGINNVFLFRCFTNPLEVSHPLVLALTDSYLWLPLRHQIGSVMFSCQRHVWHDVSKISPVPSLLRAEVQTPNQLNEIDSIIYGMQCALSRCLNIKQPRESWPRCTDALRAVKPCFSVADTMTFPLQCILCPNKHPHSGCTAFLHILKIDSKYRNCEVNSTEEATCERDILHGTWASEFLDPQKCGSMFSVNRETESTNNPRNSRRICAWSSSFHGSLKVRS